MKKKDNKLKIPKPLKFKEYEEMDVLEDYNLILDNKITRKEGWNNELMLRKSKKR